MKPLIRIRHLEVCKNATCICRAAEFEVHPGERIAIVGPNGSGKTTLLRVIGALESQYAGECRVDVPKRECVYVHQTPYLLTGTVLFNATYGLAARGMIGRDRIRIAHQWLNRMGIDGLADRQCKDLSGGEKRRLALVRALAIQPRVLLLDEPFADLDEDGINTVCDALAEAPDATILLASPVPLPDRLGTRVFSLR